MAFQNNKPNASDFLSQSQDDILNNFGAIKTLVDVNHVTFDAADQGKHNFIQFPVSGIPLPTTGAGEVGLYSQASTITGQPELVFSHQNAGTTYEFTSAVKNEDGYTMLPSGIIFKWGAGLTAPNATTTVTFANGAGIPDFTTVFNVQVTRAGGIGDGGICYKNTNTLTTLKVFNTAEVKKFFYLVIGI